MLKAELCLILFKLPLVDLVLSLQYELSHFGQIQFRLIFYYINICSGFLSFIEFCNHFAQIGWFFNWSVTTFWFIWVGFGNWLYKLWFIFCIVRLISMLYSDESKTCWVDDALEVASKIIESEFLASVVVFVLFFNLIYLNFHLLVFLRLRHKFLFIDDLADRLPDSIIVFFILLIF